MAKETVTATAKDESDQEISESVTYDFGDDLAGSQEKFGAEAVYARFKAGARVDLQALIRRSITGKDAVFGETLQKVVDEWVPGATKPRKSKSEKAADAFAELGDDERKELLKKLRAMAAAA